ncbi:putative plant self-incompatibility S1 [Helianthus annuus]|uniref:S-protein homolog n=1 Tax=Helianthus annuus TaxID=4232 RepID=A0A251TW83_HELAN|nr:putative plant self-incompatibility S1 [Helianthus annuus]KAJ0525943.1 putative plant self-incompatibility S1 [Helianthus annuus]KAJ0534226.1 putative plant self-incompatibility S1 [Helianthus annuus]KAJ0542339.1 putative plant self-incompatibility S1 [Helianthus annuus]KAJ0629434.1 putative plant self-incompatibility S1 [Helianthus annuus]
MHLMRMLLATMMMLIVLRGRPVVHIQTEVNNLRFHCHSKDDDLGNGTRNAGEEYQIRFCLDVFGRLLFTCHFNWESKQREFYVYHQAPLTRTQPYCVRVWPNLECYWRVENDGFYIPQIFVPQPGDWVKRYWI